MAPLQSPKGKKNTDITTAAFTITSNNSEVNNSKHKSHEKDPFDDNEKTSITSREFK